MAARTPAPAAAGSGAMDGPERLETPAWDLEVKPDTDEPMRGFLCPADDEDDQPPEALVPAIP